MMKWEIVPFEGMGPIKFGMSPNEVANLIGEPRKIRRTGASLRESRDIDAPIIRYKNSLVSEIEAFYTVSEVILSEVKIFEAPGIDVLRKFETMNGGAMINVGIIIFEHIGITVGRIDQDARGDHSFTAFRRGLWDNNISLFQNISFT